MLINQSDVRALAVILLKGDLIQGFGLDDMTQPENFGWHKRSMDAFALCA